MTTDKPEAEPKPGEGSPLPSTESKGGLRSSPIVGLVFCLLGGVLVALILQQIHPVFTNTEDVNAFGILPDEFQDELDWQNATLVLSLMGGIIAAGLAVAEAFSRRSITTALLGGIACFVGGALIGALAGYLGNMFYKYYETKPEVTDLSVAIRVYGTMFAIMGAGVGLSAGVFLGRRIGVAAYCLIAGILGGLAAGLIYPVVCAFVFPMADTNILIPLSGAERMLWCGLAGGLIGLVVPALAGKRSG